MKKISKSGVDGKDESLYEKAEFFYKMHALECDKARHNRPGYIQSAAAVRYENNDDNAGPATSSKNRKLESGEETRDRQWTVFVTAMNRS